jgi:hypothetical protein
MKKRNLDIRKKTLDGATNVLMHLFNFLNEHKKRTKKDYAPEKDAWYIINFNNETKHHDVKPANIFFKRHQMSLFFLKSYGLIDRKTIDGMKSIKWTGGEPDAKMVHDICVILNNQKNHKNETDTAGDVSQPFHQTAIDFETDIGSAVERSDSEKIDLILEKITKMETVLAVLNGGPIL